MEWYRCECVCFLFFLRFCFLLTLPRSIILLSLSLSLSLSSSCSSRNTEVASADFFYGDKFKSRFYQRDLLSFVTNQMMWLKELYAKHVHNHSTKSTRSMESNKTLLKGGPPGIKQKPGKPAPISPVSLRRATKWEEVAESSCAGKDGLCMLETEYLKCLSSVGLTPALLTKKDSIHIFAWITGGRRKM